MTSARLDIARAIDDVTFRTYRGPEDLPGIVDVLTASHLADGFDYLPTVDQLRVVFEHPSGYDPRRHYLVAETDGRIIAVGHASHRIRDGEDSYAVDPEVHPDHRDAGIGPALLPRLEAVAREMAAERTADGAANGSPSLISWCVDSAVQTATLFLDHGYAPVRYFFEMVRSPLDDIPEAPLPADLEIRPVRPEDHRRIFDAEDEAFRDHWGAHPWTEADFESMFGAPELDTSLWRVAWAGDEVAGVCANWIYEHENERLGLRRGWLEQVSVRRPWRRRGVARALIAESLRAFRDLGLNEGALGVDAENPNGALGLYEGLGFRVAARATAYRKPLRDS
jgi:mycothiol synthase